MTNVRSQIRRIGCIDGERSEVWICLDDLITQFNEHVVEKDKKELIPFVKLLANLRTKILK